VRSAELAQPLADEKYGMPPLVPAIVVVTVPVDRLFVMIDPSPLYDATPAPTPQV
jgi:hypothetical protein